MRYEPGESDSGLFGGNSNWRGPIWFPVNYLLIESLQKFHHYYGDDFKVECPTGSGRYLTLDADRRRTGAAGSRSIFLATRDGRRPVFGDYRAAADTTRTSATTCCSTSTSTATRPRRRRDATRPAGRG